MKTRVEDIMGESYERVEPSILDIIAMINFHFEEVGNFIGDLLFFLEVRNLSANTNASYNKQIKNLVNKYSQRGDIMLNKYKNFLLRDIKELIFSLNIELNKTSSLLKDRHVF